MLSRLDSRQFCFVFFSVSISRDFNKFTTLSARKTFATFFLLETAMISIRPAMFAILKRKIKLKRFLPSHEYLKGSKSGKCLFFYHTLSFFIFYISFSLSFGRLLLFQFLSSPFQFRRRKCLFLSIFCLCNCYHKNRHIHKTGWIWIKIFLKI